MDLFGEEPSEASEDLIDSSIEETTGLLPPRETDLCLGHKDIETRFLKLFQSGKLSHAYIFNGLHGIGKSTMAFRFARFLLSHPHFDPMQDSLFGDEPDFSSMNIDKNSTTFRQVASGGHPDLLTVERDYDSTKNKRKETLDVEQIRKIEPFLRMTSSYGGWRVVIVDDANMMNRNAQNALLKILEEPPKRTMIILIAHTIGALLPTILSRVQIIPFQALSDEIVSDLLAREEFEDEEDCVQLAAGSIGLALNYAQAEAGDMLKDIIELCEDDLPWSKKLSFAERIAKDRQGQDYRIFEMLCLWILKQAAVAKARGQVSKTMKERFQSFSLEQLLGVCDNLAKHFAMVHQANLDKRQGVLQALSIMG